MFYLHLYQRLCLIMMCNNWVSVGHVVECVFVCVGLCVCIFIVNPLEYNPLQSSVARLVCVSEENVYSHYLWRKQRDWKMIQSV